MTKECHYVLCRRQTGFGSGPGNGWQAPDRIQVMAASRTEAGLERRRRRLGGFVWKIDGQFRRYRRNETIQSIY